MNIVHFSDIHLSSKNHQEFYDNFRDALIQDLLNFQKKHGIVDLITITGDLVDRGGHSLLNMEEYEKFDCPFKVFEEVFIEPLSKELGLAKHQFLFVPGNHDIDESEVLWVDEKELKEKITQDNISEYLQKNDKGFTNANDRIKRFKKFEEAYHLHNPLYKYTNNQSTFVYEYQGRYKVGFILVNDSWRCSTCEVKDEEYNKHYFGYRQLYFGIDELKKAETDLNICLFHHPIQTFEEGEEVLRCLKTKNVDLFLYGHSHKHSSEHHIDPFGGCYGIKGRATLNSPKEPMETYQSGYQVLELNIETNRLQKVHYRKYSYKNTEFIDDTETAPKNGIDDNRKNGGIGYVFEDKKGDKKSNFDHLDVTEFKRPPTS